MIRLFQFASAVLVLAFVSLLAAITTMHFAIHGAEVTIPDFRGMTVPEATHKAVLLGMNLSVDNRFYSAEVPADRVLSQSPAPGTVVRREWHVRITQSLGPTARIHPKRRWPGGTSGDHSDPASRTGYWYARAFAHGERIVRVRSLRRIPLRMLRASNVRR